MMDGFEKKFCLKGGSLCFSWGWSEAQKTATSLKSLNRFTPLASCIKQMGRKTSF